MAVNVTADQWREIVKTDKRMQGRLKEIFKDFRAKIGASARCFAKVCMYVIATTCEHSRLYVTLAGSISRFQFD